MSELGPITAELRRVMNHTTMAGIPLVEIGEYEFGHRCDAIDAVHAALERENAELRQRLAVLDESADSMHGGWVRLPLDADGVPIYVGDVMDFSKNVRNLTVLGIGTVDGGCSWGVFVREGDDYVWYNAHFLHHHRAPTVEDVLREFGRAWVEWEDGSPHDPIAKYAAKLRLAGDAE